MSCYRFAVDTLSASRLATCRHVDVSVSDLSDWGLEELRRGEEAEVRGKEGMRVRLMVVLGQMLGNAETVQKRVFSTKQAVLSFMNHPGLTRGAF